MEEVEKIAGRIVNDILSRKDRMLLNFAVQEHPSQEELDRILQSWDLEEEGSQKAILLSYVEKLHPELVFPPELGPRLNGLLLYYRFQNLRLMAQFKTICTALHNEGIQFMPIKGAAVKFLRPDFSREMADMDILVGTENFRRAVRTVRKLGFSCTVDVHSADFYKKGVDEGVIDIHRFLYFDSGEGKNLNEGFFSRATPSEIFKVEGLMPCNEDLLFIALTNLTRNVMDRRSLGGIPFTMMDFKYLVTSKPDFDWDIVVEDAVKSSSEAELSFAATFINSVIPEMVPEKLQKLAGGKAFDDFLSLLRFRYDVLCPLQRRSHELGISQVIRHPNQIPAFIKVRPKYTLLKQIKKSPSLVRIFQRQTHNLSER